MIRKIVSVTMLVAISLHSLFAYAETVPHRVSADTHIKTVMYDPNNVVILKGRYGYQTQITFAPNEIVQHVSLGDSLAWQAVPISNHLFIKPVAESKTNMTVLTNTNSYSFQLDSLDNAASPTYKLQFMYSEGGINSADGTSNAVGTFDPEKLNWKYSFTGDKALVPTEAFDNGQFTYFKFKTDGMSHMPSVFMVDDKKETLVNYHVQGAYLVINAISKQYTFRDGHHVTSIYNDLAIGDWKSV